MEILFKGDNVVYYIESDKLYSSLFDNIETFEDHDLTNIKHLNDIQPLYHYIGDTIGTIVDSKNGGALFNRFNSNINLPVYYEYNGRIVSKVNNKYVLLRFRVEYIKDYTLVNLNLI